MKIERIPISSLVGDPANVRKHNTKNLDAIKGSLAKFGQQKPIVVGANNVVIAGNGTLAAAVALGWNEIDVVRSQLLGPDATAFAIADNRTAELAEWDDELLRQQLASLAEYDDRLLEATGFEDPLAGAPINQESPREGPHGFDYGRETYEAKPFKQLILIYPAEELADITRQLDQIMQEHELESHSDVLKHLLGKYD
jgi:hypothetical protein